MPLLTCFNHSRNSRMTGGPEANPTHFVTNILPLYHGPLVKIRIEPSGIEYAISKDLLSAKSPVFSKMFEGKFVESQQQTAILKEEESIVSVRSLEALFQWLYLRVIKFDIEDAEEHMSAAMELVRHGDKYDIIGLDHEMAQHIKGILLANPHPTTNQFHRHIDNNTYCVTSHHIFSAARLPRGHPVRHILAAASVEGYLRSETHKFAEETQQNPIFGADVLQQVRLALNGIKSVRGATFEDPITGVRSELNSDELFWD
ncbi:hypothetical protein F1880_007641 [Penicillium rolfsii]|nr:hypothetical protein F1880_007641 [Penicillium rolfsii]